MGVRIKIIALPGQRVLSEQPLEPRSAGGTWGGEGEGEVVTQSLAEGVLESAVGRVDGRVVRVPLEVHQRVVGMAVEEGLGKATGGN